MDPDVLQDCLLGKVLLSPGFVPRDAVGLAVVVHCSENLPKVAMFQDLASRFSSLCPTSNTFAVTVHGYACSAEEVSSMTPFPADFSLAESDRAELLSLQTFDHPSSPDASLVVFSSYFRDLSSWLSQARPFLLRPFHSAATSPRNQTRLGGYGIALDIKNTEYKVLDDRSSVGERLSASEVASDATETQGFFFSTLRRRYPSLGPSLQAFRESLEQTSQATAESIPPLALKDLGLKAAARVTRGKDPLRQLKEVSCDLPAVAAAVARVPVAEELREEMKRLRGRWEGSENTVLVNGRRVDFASTTLNVFELQQWLRESDLFAEALQERNLTNQDAAMIRSLLAEEREAFRLPRSASESDAILFFNDIARDRRYRHFAKSLEPFRSPLFQLPMVRANYLTRVLVLDPITTSLATLQGVYEMLLQGYPVRLGLVLFSPAAARALRGGDSPDDVLSGQLLRLCASLGQSKRKMTVLAFLINFLAQGDFSLPSALAIYHDLTDQNGELALQAEWTRRKALAGCEWAEQLGLRPNMELVNGRVASLQALQNFFQMASEELDAIVQAVAEEKIDSLEELIPFLYQRGRVVPQFAQDLLQSFDQQEIRPFPPALRQLRPLWRGENGTMVLRVATVAQLAQLAEALPSFLTKTVYLSTPGVLRHFAPLLALLRELDALATFPEFVTCMGETPSRNALLSCAELYLDETDATTFKTKLPEETDIPATDSLESLFPAGKACVLLDGRFIELPSISSSLLLTLVSTTDRFIGRFRDAFPSHSTWELLYFIHRHLASFSAETLSFPPSPLVVHIPSKTAVMHVEGIIDPLSHVTQRLSSLLSSLRHVIPVEITLLLLPRGDYSELPLRRFYRWVLDGREEASWHELPRHYVYTMTQEAPFKWNMVAYYAESDLDNLRVLDEFSYVLVQYVVDGVIVEGDR